MGIIIVERGVFTLFDNFHISKLDLSNVNGLLQQKHITHVS